MRKEVIIALIIGISFGLVVAFGVRIASQSLSAKHNVNPSPKNLAKQAGLDTNHTILITSPEPEEITNTSPIKIIGTTSPLSMVSARSGSNSNTGIADDTGAFTIELNLKPGPNIVAVDSFHPGGDVAKVEFVAVVSSADLTATSSAKTGKSETK